MMIFVTIEAKRVKYIQSAMTISADGAAWQQRTEQSMARPIRMEA